MAVGGAFGAVARYVLSGLTYRYVSAGFPWGTLAVNCLGAFLAGFFWELCARSFVPAELRTFLFIGVLGALTTFSTYTLETLSLCRDGEFGQALVNVVLNNAGAFSLAWAGMILFRYAARFLK